MDSGIHLGITRHKPPDVNWRSNLRQGSKDGSRRRLAGGVAHDFNNLLTVINGYSELILTELSLSDAMQAPLAAIHDAGYRAARLTKQQLALSRKSMFDPKLVDLNELVAELQSLSSTNRRRHRATSPGRCCARGA